MKFVGRISREGDKRRMVIIPRRLHDDIEILEGLDLLITLKPIVVDDDDKAAPLGAADKDRYKIKDWNPSPISQLHPALTKEELEAAEKRCTYCGVNLVRIGTYCFDCAPGRINLTKEEIDLIKRWSRII